AHLVGKTLQLPLTRRHIPIIADSYVDREFGTGCVKITPAHDFNDYAIGQRHKLPMQSVLTLDAKIVSRADEERIYAGGRISLHTAHLGIAQFITDYIPHAYRGLDRYDARKSIVADLDAQGLLIETKPHKLQVPISQRSDAVIEPMLTDQWFVDLTSTELPSGRAHPPGGPGGKTQITEPALQAVTSGAITFVPENWATTYTQWLENIQDWCISRQLW
ncbi:valyl-tRNA synthetase, partial [mine drainage metagenome]